MQWLTGRQKLFQSVGAYSECGDRFSNHNFHRDSKTSTHIAKNSILHSQYASGPVVGFFLTRTVCVLVREVRVGGTMGRTRSRKEEEREERGVWDGGKRCVFVHVVCEKNEIIMKLS